MALYAAFQALGASASAFLSYFGFSGSSTPQPQSADELKKLFVERGPELHAALSKAYGPSSAESRELSKELALLLSRINFETVLAEFNRCVASETSTCVQAKLCFRANTFSTRTCMELLRLYSQNYIETISQPLQHYLGALSDEELHRHEVFERKIAEMGIGEDEKPEYMRKAQDKVINICSIALDSVLSTPVPLHIQYLIKIIQQQADAELGSENASDVAKEGKDDLLASNERFDAVGGVLILRLIVPALVSLKDASTSAQRLLIIVGQRLQSLSNGVTSSSKEPDIKFLDPWHETNVPVLQQWKAMVLQSAPQDLASLVDLPMFEDTLSLSQIPTLAKCIASLDLRTDSKPTAGTENSQPLN